MDKKIYLYLCFFAVFAVSLYSQDSKVNRFFDANDRNGDNKITPDELLDTNAFQILDKNNDGVITRGEIDPNAESSDEEKEEIKKNKQTLKMLARFDTNFDGKVSESEWGGAKELFFRLDKNKDGFIDKNEILRGRLNKKDFGRENLKKDAFGNDDFNDGFGRKKNGNQRRQNFLDNLDENGDGKISQSEWKGPQKAFSHLDKNSDGFIDKNEFPKRGKNREGDNRRGDNRRGDNRRGDNRRGDNRREERDGMRERGHQIFRLFDKNEDGAITKEEWLGKPEGFERLDRNKDGRIDKEDRKEGDEPLQRLEKMLKKMDRNQDGIISSDEWVGDEERFSKLDTNADGSISEAEIKEKLSKGRKNKFQDRREFRENRERDGKNFKEHVKKRLEKFDLNGDGKISADEWPHDIEKFNRLDKNGDGFLSKEDRERGG